MNKKNIVKRKMIAFDHGDPKRIQHFLKVASFANMIAIEEGLDDEIVERVTLAGYVHDIGIIVAESQGLKNTPKRQEEFGPKPAMKLLKSAGYDDALCQRVGFIVGHHHTISAVDDIDFQILVEADYLVNAYEDGDDKEKIKNARDHFFKTASGIRIINEMFDLEG